MYMLFESVILVMAVYFLFYFLFYKKETYFEMISSYECGFDPKSEARFVFSYKFFMVSILFIIFDVEISLMISIPFFMISELGLFIFFFFVFVLIVGLLYEYYYGSLDWLLYYQD
uniref:NADH dehydrogenase subunit 3 n=1 Tax=Phoneutria boliviensis TaxID=2598454 RepID=UPI001D0FE6BF|nr:NADH dehydrogenase subunit 3 [Phoneutria boliviensis]UBY46225.1 NADH dehydrogenase subunit 3 [Phoneutria boliviensis]